MSEQQWGLQATHRGAVPTSLTLGPIVTWMGPGRKQPERCPLTAVLTRAGWRGDGMQLPWQALGNLPSNLWVKFNPQSPEPVCARTHTRTHTPYS